MLAEAAQTPIRAVAGFRTRIKSNWIESRSPLNLQTSTLRSPKSPNSLQSPMNLQISQASLGCPRRVHNADLDEGKSGRPGENLCVDSFSATENKESAAPRMFQLSFSEVPDKEYFMVGKRVVEATKEINTILSELKLTRRRVSMTVEGKLFVSGQFRIRLGQLIVQSKRTSTVVLEVQHLSSPSEESEPFIKELTTFIHGFLSADTINSVPVAFSNFSLPTTSFTPKHRALQYVHLVQQAMSSSKKSQAAAASSNSVGGASSAGHTSMPWSSTGSEEKKR
ncbi:hypothetical protein AAMO2058_000854400 [Amorphochlora amoebiformis]